MIAGNDDIVKQTRILSQEYRGISQIYLKTTKLACTYFYQNIKDNSLNRANIQVGNKN